VLTCGRTSTGGRPRRRPTAVAAGGVTPASWLLGLANKPVWDFWWCKGKVGAACVCSASSRRVELAMGTTGGGNSGLVVLQTRVKDGGNLL
jgi:hypothetical protein